MGVKEKGKVAECEGEWMVRGKGSGETKVGAAGIYTLMRGALQSAAGGASADD